MLNRPVQHLRERLATLPREGRDTLFLLAVVAWVLLPHAARLPAWCTALSAGLLAWRARIALAGGPLPGRAWMAGLLAVVLGLTLWSHHTLLGRDAGVTLIAALLALKTLELRARRDAFVVFFLGFFTLLTHLFFSQSLATAAAMALGLLGLLAMLVNAHAPVGRPPLARSAGVALRLVAIGLPAMLLLFALFPRLPPLWGLPADGLVGRTGLSDSLRVGDVARLALDDGIALRVRFEGPPPERSDLYFRGPVLAGFDGRAWRPLHASPATLPAPRVVAARAAVEVAGEPLRYTLVMEPSNRPWLPLLELAAQPPEVPGQQVLRTPEQQWLLAAPATDLLSVRAESHLRWRMAAATRLAALPLEYRELPPGYNPRTLQLATDLMRRSPAPPEDKAALVRAALALLRGGGFRYTLEPGLYGEHGADEFWFDRREGFCEHIASAFAVLMRAMDIPARIVTGYQGGEPEAATGRWIVRNSDAHAWVEVWLEGRGWQRVDPTAAVAPGRTGALQRLAPPPGAFAAAVAAVNPDLAASLRAAWDAINLAWNQRVLNYTPSRQLDLLRSLGLQAAHPQDLLRLLAAVMAALALGGAAWALWERRGPADPWLRQLARARRALGRAGLALPPSAGPRALADAATGRWGEAARPLADWLLRLEALRYAPVATRPPGLDLRGLRREWRRLACPPAGTPPPARAAAPTPT